MVPKSKNELKDAICNLDNQKLVAMALLNKSKQSSFSFRESLRDFKEYELEKMWDHLKTLIESNIEKIFEHDKRTLQTDKKISGDVSSIIQAILDLTFAALEIEVTISENLLHMVVCLNGIIFLFPASADSLQSSIVQLCERVYHLHKDKDKKSQYFMYNTILYLFRHSLGRKAKKSDVKRLYGLRKIIPKLITMEEIDKDNLWDLLIKCTILPLYVSMTEGQKIISMILTLDTSHLIEMHGVIKHCLLHICTPEQGAIYGKIYFDAWSYAVKHFEDLKNVIEVNCLKDILVLAMQERPAVLPVPRKFLSYFHLQKKELHVSKMLHSLYKPVLWLYLRSPDGGIRANACQIFLDVFPLEDPDDIKVSADLELSNQMLMIKDLLLDECPAVRYNAVVGTCISMSVNWEIFSEEMLKTYFKIFVKDLSCDSSSIEVRAAVAKGMKALLENPLTLPTVKCVLPRLAGLIDDVSESVKLAFLGLLLRVKNISCIKYFDIVPVEHLLARMVEDSATVAMTIVSLLHNSFFPKDENASEWMLRCSSLIKDDQEEARVFFQYVPRIIGAESSVKFMVFVVKAIYVRAEKNSVKSRSTDEADQMSEDSKEDTSDSHVSIKEPSLLEDPAVVAAFIDAVVIMWYGLLPTFEEVENKKWLKLLVGKLTKYVPRLTIYYKDALNVWPSIYYLSSMMPADTIPTLPSLCFARLTTLDSDILPGEYIVLLESLIIREEGMALLELIKEWILAGFADSSDSPATKKRKITEPKRPVFKNLYKPRPLLGVHMLNAMLGHKRCQKALLTRFSNVLKDMLNIMDNMKRKIEKADKNKINEAEATFLKTLFFVLLQLSVLLSEEKKCDAVKFMEDLISWADKKLIKILKAKSLSEISVDVVSSFFKDVYIVLGDMFLLNLIDLKSFHFVDFGLQLLTLDSGPVYLLPVSKLLSKYSTYAHVDYFKNKKKDTLRPIIESFFKITQCLSNENFVTNIPVTEKKDAVNVLATLLQTIYQHSLCVKESIACIFKAVIKSTLNFTIKKIEKMNLVSEMMCEPFSKIDLPKTGAFFLSIVTMKVKMIPFYVKWFTKYFSTIADREDIQLWIACCVILFSILESKKLPEIAYKEMKGLLNFLEQALSIIYPQKTDSSTSKEDPLVSNKNILNTKDDEKQQRFEEHCYQEFGKLKELFLQKQKAIN